MKRLASLVLVTILVAVGLMSRTVYATAPSGDLAIIEIKPTSSESAVIENITSTTLNLQNYILEYFNKSVPASFNVPTSTQQLPNFTLAPNQTFLLTGDSISTCGASGVASMGISLSDSSGYLEVVKISASGGNVSYTQQDKVSWSSTASGADIISVPSATTDANAVWYRKLTDGTWNKYEIDATSCNLFVAVVTSSGPTYVDWAVGAQAPSEIVLADSSASSSIPTADMGLAAPQLTELLPNPALPQSDSEDEFIELYNPNDQDFDLSGFKLQVGLSTVHTYIFPGGTLLPAKSFKAYYSVDTNLAMSNTSGQARLIDPLGSIISQSEPYSAVKEGQSWSLVQGKWYWANPTPEKPNSTTLSLSTATSVPANSQTAAVKSASTNSPSTASSSQPTTKSTQPTKIHTWTIAVIGSAALLYALYEYRVDIQNRLYQFRRYREARRASGWLGGAAIVNRVKSRSWWRQNNASKRHSPRAKKPHKRK